MWGNVNWDGEPDLDRFANWLAASTMWCQVLINAMGAGRGDAELAAYQIFRLEC